MGDNLKKGKVTLGATGDILLHKRLYNKALESDNSGYNFGYMLEEAEKLFQEDHLIIVNLETIIAGQEYGLGDFPRFNSPKELGYKLKDLNVDIVNVANNHTLDFGEEGLRKSLDNLNEIGLPYVGAYQSVEDQETVRIFHKNGLKICFLSYTVSTGLGKRPKGKEYLVNIYKDVSPKWLRLTINKIRRELNVDVVVVSIHYGREYHMLPTSSQLEISNDIADAGADIILGHHPHVLQPPNFLIDSRGREVFVAYSLGNFFTGQVGLYRQIGAYMTLDIEKDFTKGDSLLNISNPKMKLTYVDQKDYKIKLLEDVVEESDTIKTNVGEFSSNEVYLRMINHMKYWLPDLEIS